MKAIYKGPGRQFSLPERYEGSWIEVFVSEYEPYAEDITEARIPVSKDTRDWVKMEAKKKGMTYDQYIMRTMMVMEKVNGGYDTD